VSQPWRAYVNAHPVIERSQSCVGFVVRDASASAAPSQSKDEICAPAPACIDAGEANIKPPRIPRVFVSLQLRTLTRFADRSYENRT
jgi:hypothetical protein